MLITDLPYKQKYLTTCMEMTNYLITFSGMEGRLEAVPHLMDGGWWRTDGWYFPEVTIKIDNKSQYLLTFSFTKTDTPHILLGAIIPELRALARKISYLNEEAPLPTSQVMCDAFLNIYQKVWEQQK